MVHEINKYNKYNKLFNCGVCGLGLSGIVREEADIGSSLMQLLGREQYILSNYVRQPWVIDVYMSWLSLFHSLMHVPTHSLTYSCSLTHSLTHLFILLT